MTAGNGHESWHVPNRAPKYSEHSDSADMSALHSPAGDLHIEALGRQHSDQAWPLKTSGSRCAHPPPQEGRLRNSKEVLDCVLPKCAVNSLMADKKLLSWAEMTLDPALSSCRVYPVKPVETFFPPFFFISWEISKQESGTVYPRWQRGNEKGEAECQLSSQCSLT